MTLPKKKSRPIKVDEVAFRYAISLATSGEDGVFPLNLTVQIEEGHGRILKARGMLTRDFWLDFPSVGPSDQYLTLLPKHVSEIVRLARASGWNPTGTGQPFELEVNAEMLRR